MEGVVVLVDEEVRVIGNVGGLQGGHQQEGHEVQWV